MANFKSWKDYMLYLIDRLVIAHHLKGPFLDAGCGGGDVSIHFARQGWEGTAIDFSEEVCGKTRDRLKNFSHIEVRSGDLFDLEAKSYRTVFLMDVIEHVKDDYVLIERLGSRLEEGAHLVATVPVNPSEWRWDDDFYGHYRRYTRAQLRTLLAHGGFTVIEEWDCSFPIFWFMRRVYTRLFPAQVQDHLSPEERTSISTCQSAWDASRLSLMIDWIFQKTHLAMLHYPFRKGTWGCEILLVARKDAAAAAKVKESAAHRPESLRPLSSAH